MTQRFDLTPKKQPRQSRSRATFAALVEACAQLLPRLGYDRLTTNAIAERAGVAIGSLYEYFPGKDAVVAQAATELVERVMTRLEGELDAILEKPGEDPVARWIAAIHATLLEEQPLIAVFTEQVPFTSRIDAVRDLDATLLRFSERARRAAGIELPESATALLLINNLVSTTLLQVVVSPPDEVTRAGVIEALSDRVGQWLSPAWAAR